MRRLSKGRTPIYRDWTLLQLALLTLVLDQLTKFVVRQTLEWRYSWPPTGFLRFTHIHNTGSAFGLFQDQNLPLLFVSLVGVLVLAYIYQSQPHPTRLLRVSISLMMGGALGNLIDRVHQGHVTDFIDVGPWPVFNLADSAIVVGLIVMGWLLVMRREETTAATATPDGVADDTSTCPICDGLMITLRNGARCADCGVRERILSSEQGASRDHRP